MLEHVGPRDFLGVEEEEPAVDALQSRSLVRFLSGELDGWSAVAANSLEVIGIRYDVLQLRTR